jgi:hypothetical protein
VCEGSSFSKTIWDIFSIDLDVFIVGTEIFSSIIPSFIDLYDGLGCCVAIVVRLHLLFFIEARVVEDKVLLCEDSLFVLVDLIVVIPTQECPSKGRNGSRTATPHK